MSAPGANPDMTPESASASAEPAAAFTPGPWRVYEQASYFGIAGPTGRSIARTAYGRSSTIVPEQVANARLITAAPDLLAALENLAELCADVFVKAAECDDLIAARAAIAKAIGQ